MEAAEGINRKEDNQVQILDSETIIVILNP